jgi:hypothetical protein
VFFASFFFRLCLFLSRLKEEGSEYNGESVVEFKPKLAGRFFLKDDILRKKLIQHIFGKIVLIQHIFCHLGKTIVICTPERESARDDDRKATNNDRGTCALVFVEIFGVER